MKKKTLIKILGAILILIVLGALAYVDTILP